MANRRKKPTATTAQPGYWAAKSALMKFGEHAFDGRTRVAKALDEARSDLVASLGGSDALSKQQEMIVAVATRTHFLLESLDAFIFSMPSPVNKRRRALYPVVRERQQLADSLARLLGQLGLERRAKPVKSLAEYISEDHEEAEQAPPEQVTEAEEEKTAP
jgi:hypothetical protein